MQFGCLMKGFGSFQRHHFGELLSIVEKPFCWNDSNTAIAACIFRKHLLIGPHGFYLEYALDIGKNGASVSYEKKTPVALLARSEECRLRCLPSFLFEQRREKSKSRLAGRDVVSIDVILWPTIFSLQIFAIWYEAEPWRRLRCYLRGLTSEVRCRIWSSYGSGLEARRVCFVAWQKRKTLRVCLLCHRYTEFDQIHGIGQKVSATFLYHTIQIYAT